MERKALFFDVDGTLFSEITRTVPESAVRAVQKARSLGHVVFINSGRVYCMLDFLNKLVETDGVPVRLRHQDPGKRQDRIRLYDPP